MDVTPPYRLVYDAATAWYPDWWVTLVPLLFMVGILVTLYQAERLELPREKRLPMYVGAPLCAFMAMFVFTSTYPEHARTREALREGRYIVVEGTVENFQPSDIDGHEPERWSVRSGGRVHKYEYVSSVMAPGFRWTAARGGPIRPGLRVRIADVGGYIARLEVAP